MEKHVELMNQQRVSRPFVVPADTSRWGELVRADPFIPFTKVSTKDTGGAWSMFEGIAPPGARVPLHLHHDQEEWFWVLDGTFTFEVGGEQFELTQGMSLLAPRGVPHRWKNSNDSQGRMLVLVQPAGMVEVFFDRFRQLSPEKQQDHELVNQMFAGCEMKVVGPPLPG